MSFLDLLRTLERITRPPRRQGLDDPLAVSPDSYYGYAEPDLREECRAPDPSDCLSCGKRCTWPAEATEQRREKAARLTAGLVAFALDPDAGERPDCSCGLGDDVKLREHWSSCAVWDDDEAAKLADMEAEMDRQPRRRTAGGLGVGFMENMALTVLNKDGTSRIIPAGEWRLADNSTEPAERTDYLGPYEEPEHFANTEPALTDDELVAVRGLIQERYDREQYVPRSLEFHQQLIDELTEFITVRTLGDTDSPAAEPEPQRCHARKPNDPPNVATFCDEWAGHGGQHRHGQTEFWCDPKTSASVIPTGADAEPDSPAASAPGVSGEAVSPIPPVPASPHSDLSANQQAKRAAEIIDRHFPDSSELSYIKCGCRFECDRVSTWARHVAAELHPQT